MTGGRTVLVTGADQHQGLAVIRGLGRVGVRVIAAGSESKSLGFASRYAADHRLYASPFADPMRATADLLAIIRATRPAVVVPTVEATLVLLNEARAEVERYSILAAPPAETLEYALDKGRTLHLARACEVPAPRTAVGARLHELLREAEALRFPVAIKPRGHSLHPGTSHRLGFKVQYARSIQELATLLAPHAQEAHRVLVQERVRGVGRCVAAVCDRGRPLTLFAYERTREVPLSGGVSVARRSIELDRTLRRYTTMLLGELRWHGVAMVEYKYDESAGTYTLMEINGRFQASTALALDAGVNLPYLVAALHARWPRPPLPTPRVGVEARWLRGDLAALGGAWRGPTPAGRDPILHALLATWRFVWDFRPGMHYDEFSWDDPRPALQELLALMRGASEWVRERVTGAWRRGVAAFTRRRIRLSASVHRSMRVYTASKSLRGRS